LLKNGKNFFQKVHIGTSGWHYKQWIGPFYPEKLPKKDMLKYYVQFFSTTEINNSFYKLPDKNTFQNWAEQVPENFTFSVKASRYITHMKKLKNSRESLNRFMEGIKPIGNHLGPILFQLPPRWRCNPQRLSSFLEGLPPGNQYVFEFRDPSWWNETIYNLLKDHGAAFCIFELAGELSPLLTTSDFVYIRLHGPGDAYQGSYSETDLRDWAAKIKQWYNKGKTVYLYFDNDQAGFAAKNALRLKGIVKNS